jgi:hypothetical protein
MRIAPDYSHVRGRPLPDDFDPIVPVEDGERLRIRSAYGTFISTMGSYYYEVIRERLLWADIGQDRSSFKTPEEAKRWAKQSAAQTRRNHRIREEKRSRKSEG